MRDGVAPPALFLDFDNTITRGDVLDRIIERFSVSEDWREAEELWLADRISTLSCLTRQVRGLRVTAGELRQFVAGTALDAGFPRLLDVAARAGIAVVVVSDNFSPVIDAILASHGITGLDVRANELDLGDDTPKARFPWRDPACARCAHCKAIHVRRSARRPRIFAGDGRSDLCPAIAADVVFAKDALAAELERRGTAFHPFATLADIVPFIEVACDIGATTHSGPRLVRSR